MSLVDRLPASWASTVTPVLEKVSFDTLHDLLTGFQRYIGFAFVLIIVASLVRQSLYQYRLARYLRDHPSTIFLQRRQPTYPLLNLLWIASQRLLVWTFSTSVCVVLTAIAATTIAVVASVRHVWRLGQWTIQSIGRLLKAIWTSVMSLGPPGPPRRSPTNDQQRVVFDEHSNGQVKTTAYYYNPLQEPSSTAERMESKTPPQSYSSTPSTTPLPRRRILQRQQTPPATKPLRSQQVATTSGDKENVARPTARLVTLPRVPASRTPIAHSPGQKVVVRRLSEQVRKRRLLEQESSPHPKKYRPTGRIRLPARLVVNSLVDVEAKKRRRLQREEAVWNEMNRKRVKPQTTPAAASGTGIPAAVSGSAHTPAPQFPTGGSFVFGGGSAPTAEHQPEALAVQFGAPNAESKTDGPAFQFGAAASAPTPDAAADSTPQASSNGGPKDDGASEQPAFQFSATSTSTPAAGPTAGTPQPPMQFGSAQTDSGAPTSSAAPQPSFEFGSTAEKSPAPGPVSAAAPQPSFEFGSTAENTPAPGPVPAAAPQPSFQSGKTRANTPAPEKSLQFGSTSATTPLTFGATPSGGGFGVTTTQGGFNADSPTNTPPAFGDISSSGGFGGSPAQGGFSAGPSANTRPVFGAPSSGGGFGGASTAGSFSAGPPAPVTAPPTFGATLSGGGFGSAPSVGGFGSGPPANTTPAFSATSSGGGFGGASTQGGFSAGPPSLPNFSASPAPALSANNNTASARRRAQRGRGGRRR